MQGTEKHVHVWYVVCRGCNVQPEVNQHFVTMEEQGWFIEHSLQCRMDGEMVRGCAWQHAMEKLFEDHPVYHVLHNGRWLITDIDTDGYPKVEIAKVQPCTE